ncbi:MAG TPA: carboxypeptidase-like regulatory domain-containing protein [Terriglobales bacterium]|nr:carboxypeptidase-like regulatory domain-containing protein [Terriglobales bacterium]
MQSLAAKKVVPFLMLYVFAPVVLLTAFSSGQTAPGQNKAPGTRTAVSGSPGQVAIDQDDIGGVVTSAKGPEAGVWVIAETNELPTKFRKIVVTDDRGRYVIPDLPKATYKVWVRGYGLIDSGAVSANPGQHLALKAVVAPNAKAAAEYYPANYWYSLLDAAPKSAFPKTVTMPPDKLPYTRGAGSLQAHEPIPDGKMEKNVVETQAHWVATMKNCAICHQMGTKFTREIEPSLGTFDSSALAWNRRIRMGQIGSSMVGMLTPLGLDQAVASLANWSDRIAKGEVPPAPPRPSGVERNLVISMWDVGNAITFGHDLYTTDKRHPESNAYGPVYLGDFNSGDLHVLDPLKNADHSVKLPVSDILPIGGHALHPMEFPSLFWGDQDIYEEKQQTEVKNVDTKGRLWMGTIFRPPVENPPWCQEDSGNKFSKYFPLSSSNRQVAYYDGKTKKETWVDTCFGNHHAAYGEDADETIYWVGSGTVLAWVKPAVLDRGGTDEEAQGWCPAYYDINGDGKYQKSADKLVPNSGYYIAYNPVDKSVWYTLPKVPGSIVRMDIGSNPPETCHAEVYDPPFYNPKAPGQLGFLPRGIDVDRNGLVWVGLAGSGQLATFDRSKCKVLSGPESFDGQHCVEGWTLYNVPGPQMKNFTESGSIDFLYGTWVDQYNTLGLGKNIPIANGTGSDSLLAFIPETKKWVVLRVPYPLGFFTRNVAGRIDDANIGWKGRGLWAGNEVRNPWHIEGGKGTRPQAVHFQLRPDPLAK